MKKRWSRIVLLCLTVAFLMNLLSACGKKSRFNGTYLGPDGTALVFSGDDTVLWYEKYGSSGSYFEGTITEQGRDSYLFNFNLGLLSQSYKAVPEDDDLLIENNKGKIERYVLMKNESDTYGTIMANRFFTNDFDASQLERTWKGLEIGELGHVGILTFEQVKAEKIVRIFGDGTTRQELYLVDSSFDQDGIPSFLSYESDSQDLEENENGEEYYKTRIVFWFEEVYPSRISLTNYFYDRNDMISRSVESLSVENPLEYE